MPRRMREKAARKQRSEGVSCWQQRRALLIVERAISPCEKQLLSTAPPQAASPHFTPTARWQALTAQGDEYEPSTHLSPSEAALAQLLLALA